MRILYVAAGIPVPGTHGGSVHALELCRALAGLGHEVHLVAPPGDGSPPLPTAGGLHLHAVRRASLAQLEWTRYRQVRAIATQVAPQVVIERFYTFGGCGALAARALRVPLVLEINSPARAYPGSWRDRLDALSLLRPIDWWRQRLLHQARAFYGSSPVLVNSEHRGRFHEIPNGGVDCDRIRPGAGVPDQGPLRLLHVSSFRAWHGAEDLVSALALALRQGADVHLTCVGSGPREAAARALAAAALGSSGARDSDGRAEGDTGGRIEFLGTVSHERVAQLLAAAHVGVAPFNPERHSALRLGWYWSPIKIYEYLAAGLPVITADIEALRQQLPGDVARFYAPGDVPALAAQIEKLASDRATLRAMGLQSRALAQARYTWARHAERLAALLQATLRP